MSLIRIYSLPTYKIKLENIDFKDINPDYHANLIFENKGFHERLEKNSQLKINIDVEYIKKPVEELFNEIISFFSIYDIHLTINDICYTKNFGKIKDGVLQTSYHIVIPKYFMISSKMKQLWMKFSKDYGYTNEIDFGHLDNSGKWFRLPNQLKENVANTEHKIQRGTIKDFILQYIHKDCIDLNEHNISKIVVKQERKSTINNIHQIVINENENKLEKQINKFNIHLIQKCKNENNNEIIDLLLLIPPSYLDEFNNWLDVGILCYCILEYNIGYTIWNEISKQGKNYTSDGCKNMYSRFSRKEKTIASLHFLLKNINEIGYKNYLSKKKYLSVNGGMDKFNSVEVNTRFLINLEEEKENEDQIIIKNFIQDNYQKENIICIKSDMGTAKTTLIIHYITKYNPKKILWVTHRKSLTCNLISRFKQFGFVSYLEISDDIPPHYIYQSDRLIVQLESMLLIDYYHLPPDTQLKYDLIIIDECISLFNQFSSPTLKSPLNTYNYLQELIKLSKNTICMDADFNNRGYNFLYDAMIDYVDEFRGDGTIIGRCKVNVKNIDVLKNNFKLNDKKIVITKIRTKFNKEIFDCIENNKKIIICSMSSKEAVFYNELINKRFPNKKIYLYYSLTGDSLKMEHFNDIDKYWKQADCVIYTSTIESGVDFNLKHFNKIFCVLQENTISQRSIFQMFNRCRKIEDKTILCLNHTNLQLKSDWFWTIDEVMKCEKILQEFYEIKYVKGVKTKILSDFNKVLVWNKVEELNKNKLYFLNYFIQHAQEKGYKVEVEDLNDDTNIILMEETDTLFSKIIMSKDITYEEYMYFEYMKSFSRNNITEEENLQMEKYFYKNLLNVEELTEELLQKFYKKHKVITNYKKLLRSKTENIEELYEDKNEVLKLGIIIDLLNDLGFKDFENPTTFNFENFRHNLKETVNNNFAFTHYKECRVLFGKNKGKNEKDKNNFLEGKNTRYTLQYISGLLNEYGLDLKGNFLEGKKHKTENIIYTLEKIYN